VLCWSNCFAGGAVVEVGGGVVAHGRRLQAITLLFQAVEKEALVLPFSSVLLLFFCCVSFSLCSSLGDVSFQDPTTLVPLFLNPHDPLSFTSQCPSRLVLFFSLSIHFPSPLTLTVPLLFMAFLVFFPFLVHFPLFGSFPSLFSFFISLCLPLFLLCLLSCVLVLGRYL